MTTAAGWIVAAVLGCIAAAGLWRSARLRAELDQARVELGDLDDRLVRGRDLEGRLSQALDAIRDSSAVEDRWGAIVSANAQMLASANAEAAATATWRDNSYAALDEVTGVDLDAEAADLIRYQQAYSASARIIQVARETIQALFDAL